MAAPIGSLTAERQVTVTWDIPERVLAEPYFQKRRSGSQIRPSSQSNVMLLASGVFILKPVNLDFNALHETTIGMLGCIRLADGTAAGDHVEAPHFRQQTELGLTYDAGVPANGDFFIRKNVTAGNSWSPELTTTVPKPTLPSANLVMRRVFQTGGALHEPNTGYLLRWVMPGTKIANPDSIFSFYFGSPLIGGTEHDHTGFGQFCLSMAGSGRCTLYEWIDNAWSQVAQWRFAPPQGIMEQAGGLSIIPHYPNFIEFRNFDYVAQFDDAIDTLVSTAQAAARLATGDGAKTYVHQITNRGNDGLLNPTAGIVRALTGPGQVYFDTREDLRFSWQINRLIYPTSGTLTDRPFTIPGQVGSTHVLRLDGQLFNVTFDGGTSFATSVTLTPQNAQTSVNLAVNNTETASFNAQTIHYSGWNPPGGQNAIQVVAALANTQAGTKYQTPSFLGYEAKRDGDVETIDNGAKASLDPRDFSATGAGFSPDEETAHLLLEDTSGAYSFINNRGRMGVRVETTYSETDPKTAILFEGYLGRCDSSLRGKHGMNYPSASWRELSCDLVGKADRMRHAYFHNFEVFFDDANSSTLPTALRQPGQPWRVVDVIRHLCRLAGFDDSQLDIFEDGTRLFAQTRGNNQALYTPSLGSSILDYILLQAQTYLNAFFLWDPNAGTAGMWRLLQPPAGTETPLWNFTTQGGAAGRLQHLSASYPANTSPILTNEEFKSYVIPPEGNQLTVYGGFTKTPDGTGYHQIRSQVSNRASWNAPGFTLSDNGNLDYLGMCVPVVYTDLLLQSQQAADWTARRLFNLACRGRKFITFGAELVLVSPSDPVYSTHTHRPLRLGDTITVDIGSGAERYIIHSCSPYLRKTYSQFMRVEAELYRPQLTWGVRP